MDSKVALTPAAAAALFLTARGRGGDNAEEDTKALTSLLTEVAAAAIRTALGVDNDKLSLEEVMKEITGSQLDAKIAPGLQLAWLQDKGLFYAAVHTFPMGTVDSRTVVAKATAPDLVAAMVKCLAAFRASVR